MKILIVLTLSVAAIHCGYFGGPSRGASDGWQVQRPSAWQQQPQQLSPGSSQLSPGWQQQQQQPQASFDWQQQQHYDVPQQEQEQKLLLIKQTGGHQNTGRSLTIAGPTHLIKTVHKVHRIDNGGQILSKSGGRQGQQAKLLIVKDVKNAQVKHAQPHEQQQQQQPQHRGYGQQLQGWSSQGQQTGW